MSTQPADDSWSSFATLSDQHMLSSIGRNLRDVYEDMTEAAQPGDLLRLAALIDERRGETAP